MRISVSHLISEAAQTKFNYGTVIEVGPGKRINGKTVPMTIKKGDQVMLAGEWSGNKIKVNEKELYVVNEEEILGLVELDHKWGIFASQ